MKLLVVGLLITLARYSEAVASSTNSTTRVSSPTSAAVGDFPWVVSLIKPGTATIKPVFYCAGTLILDQWVLTTANCIGTKTVAVINVCTGDMSLSPTCTSGHAVEAVYKHPSFVVATRMHDLGLVKLKEPIPMNEKAHYLKMFRRDGCCTEFDSLTVAGWGHTESAASLATQLQYTNTTTLQTSKCIATSTFTIAQMHPGTFCTTNGQGNACSLDEGDPITMEGSLYGVVSIPVPKGNCGKDIPARNMKVCLYHDWFFNVTNFMFG